MRLVSLLIVLCLAVVAAPALAQDSTITYQSTELAPGLYMLEGQGGFAGGNIGLLTGKDGAVLIEDGLPPLTDTLLGAIGKLTDAPVDFVINTHVHGDHTGANETLGKAGATIIAHDRLRERMVEQGMQTADGMQPTPRAALPVLTFADSVTVHMNDNPAFIFHVATADTDGDAIIHFRDANVIHVGDVMFNKIFPFIDLDSGGSVAGYIAAQKKILGAIDAKTKIIPGHGPLADAGDLQASIDMLEASVKAVGKLIDAGHSEEEILAANPLKAYESWSWQFITTERMTRTIYRSLQGD